MSFKTLTYLSCTLIVSVCCYDVNSSKHWEKIPSFSQVQSLQELLSLQIVSKLDTMRKGFEPHVSRKCLENLVAYVHGLLQSKKWAVQMFDSTTKLWDGLLELDSQELGSYDECLDISVSDTPEVTFIGQHCQVEVEPNRIAPRPANRTMSGWDILSPYYDTLSKQLEMVLRLKQKLTTNPTLATCLPSTCSPSDWHYIMDTTLNQTLDKIGSPVTVKVIVDKTTCYNAESMQLSTTDKIGIFSLLLILLTVVLSTVYDLRHQDDDDRNELWTAFSFYTNGKHLFSTEKTEGSLAALNGLRVLAILWVIYCHTVSASILMPYVNTITLINLSYDWREVFVVNGTLSVDIFFVLSGSLLSYIFLKNMTKSHATFNLPWFYMHRYLRLTPALALVIWLKLTIFASLGSGPLWYKVLRGREECERNWWVLLSYIQNIIRPGQNCDARTWYLAVDMQLFWVSPIILFPLLKRPRFGLWVWLTALLIGLTSAFVICYTYRLVSFTTNAGRKLGTITENVNYMYRNPLTRCPAWLIGIGLGYLLHVTRGRRLRLSWVSVTLGWLVACVCLLTSFLGIIQFMTREYQYHRLSASLYVAFCRPVWALGIAWIIFACSTGNGGFINTFLSWKGFLPLSRLSYAMYLVHSHYHDYLQSSAKAKNCWDTVTKMQLVTETIIVSILLSVILFLVTEAPISIIEKVLRSRGRKSSSSESLLPQKVEPLTARRTKES